MLGVIFSGFHVIVYSVLHYLPVIMAFWCSLVYGAFMMQERDLSEYSPSVSSTSRRLPCSHRLCELGPNCKSPKEPCPYIVNYASENTSSAGFLIEDKLHLTSVSEDASQHSVRASVIMGCGREQSGGYLDGAAPDGLMGLGPGDISVPSLLAKAGLVKNSFSICFDEKSSGRIFFGDQGLVTQQSTPFLPLEGKYITYLVGVEHCCVGRSCFKQTGFQALVDSGSSFTYLPQQVYEKIAVEFDKRVNATRSDPPEGYLWKYCYKTSSHEEFDIPAMTFAFAMNQSFVVRYPIFRVSDIEGVAVFCLAIELAPGDVGVIGQNFMVGHSLVFDRESMKLGWSHSKCQDISDRKRMGLTPAPANRSPNPLPTNEQQSTPSSHAIAPAVAGRTPSNSPSVRSPCTYSLLCAMSLLMLRTWMFGLTT